jgi:hypothetical protein
MLWTAPRRVDSLSLVQCPSARRVGRHRLSSVMLQKDDAIRIGFWTLMSSPIWLPLLGFWMPRIAARRIRRCLGIVALATLLFAVANSSDRSTAQWPAMFVFMACLFFYFAGVLLTWAVDLRMTLETRRNRPAA